MFGAEHPPYYLLLQKEQQDDQMKKTISETEQNVHVCLVMESPGRVESWIFFYNSIVGPTIINRNCQLTVLGPAAGTAAGNSCMHCARGRGET